MKAALTLSVFAFAQAQFGFGGNNFFGGGGGGLYNQGYPINSQPSAQIIGLCRLQGDDRTCCHPTIWGGCNYGGSQFPPPSYLDAVCCPTGNACCPKDRTARALNYDCCAVGEVCAIDAAGLGSCATTGVDAWVITPASSLDGAGRCNDDGALPLSSGGGGPNRRPFQCTLNLFVQQNIGTTQQCPTNSACVKDRQINVNTGVCCPTTECNARANCDECINPAFTTTVNALDTGVKVNGVLTTGILVDGQFVAGQNGVTYAAGVWKVNGVIADAGVITRNAAGTVSAVKFDMISPVTGLLEDGAGVVNKPIRIGELWYVETDTAGVLESELIIALHNIPTVAPDTISADGIIFIGGTTAFVAPTTVATAVVNNNRVRCDWLTTGDLYNAEPRCVTRCANFPGRSCINYGNNRLCPAAATDTTGTNYNSGSCVRRCGNVGDGRAFGITNTGIDFVAVGLITNAIACCNDFPGDTCCNKLRELSSTCSAGRVSGGPVCGIIIRGTSLDPNFINGGFNNGFNGGFNNGFNNGGGFGNGFGRFRPFFPFRRSEEGTLKEDTDKQFFYNPGYGFRPQRPNFGGRPSFQANRPIPVTGPTVCSCDADCNVGFDDCCTDKVAQCP